MRSGVTARNREADCGRDEDAFDFLEAATALEGRRRGDVFIEEAAAGTTTIWQLLSELGEVVFLK